MNTIKREFEYYGNIIPYDVCHTGLKEKSDMEYKNYEYIGSSCVYYINGVKNTSVDLIHFYKEKGEAREIDYYLVKKECWGVDGTLWTKANILATDNSISLPYFQEIGLLSNPDYFTPVYKEVPKFKVGDKFKVIQKNVYCEGKIITVKDKSQSGYYDFLDNEYELQWKIGEQVIKATPSEIAESERPKVGDYCKKVWKSGDVDYFNVTKIIVDEIYSDCYYRLLKDGGIDNLSSDCHGSHTIGDTDKRITVSVIPKSEFDEAKQRYLAAEKIMIGGKYEVSFYNISATEKSHASIDGHLFSKEFWLAVLEVSKHSKASVVVGCNAKGLGTHKWEVTQEQIEKIISKLK